MRCLLLTLVVSAAFARADVVECENGDRYNGKVVLVDEHSVKVQNDITGLLTIPRGKVSAISFGNAKPARAASTGAVQTNAVSPPLDARAIEEVQNKFLSDATPEATQMYQKMVQDFLSGKIGVEDIRSKAQSTLNELSDLQKELGDDDAAALLGSYASILQNFLNANQGAKAPAAATPRKPARKEVEEADE